MMSNKLLGVIAIVVCVLVAANAYAGEYVPEAYYKIDVNGIESQRVSLTERIKRSPAIVNYLRTKRSSGSSSGSSSGAFSGSGGDFPHNFFADQAKFFEHIYNNVGGVDMMAMAIPPPPSPNLFARGAFGGNVPPHSNSHHNGGGENEYVHASVHSDSGRPDTNFEHFSAQPGPSIFTRSGQDLGSSIQVSGSSAGEHGSFSSSSSMVDANGKVTYTQHSGKF